jgi:amino acid adenylation domain-containing protein
MSSQNPQITEQGEIQTQGTSVVQRVLMHAKSDPDRVAVVEGALAITYWQLADRIKNAAAALQAKTVVPGDVVGVNLQRSVDALICVLACHLVGAAYVPFDPELPPTRLEAMKQVAQPTIVVVDANHSRPDWASDVSTVRWSELVQTDHDRYESTTSIDPESLAYILFTSGSTGTPKGVEITHNNLNTILTAWDQVVVLDRHVTLWLSALSFDASVTEFLWTMHAGGTLVIAETLHHPSGLGASIGEMVEAHSITHLQCTPTRAKMLLADAHDRKSFSCLEHMVIGGEPLPSRLARDLLQAGVRTLTNAYGPTEASVWATQISVTADLLSSLDTATVPIGTAIPGASVTIIEPDEEGIGEVHISGPLVGRGYRGQPELSAAVFGTGTWEGGTTRTYRTGDLGRKRLDGVIEFHGRVDGQIKLRGHRVELGEIESVLSAHPMVQHAIVELDRRHVASGDAPQDLIAAVVPIDTPWLLASDQNRVEAPELGAELRAHLAALLPSVMVPRTIVVFRSLPLTMSGKLNRVEVSAMLGNQRAKQVVHSGSRDVKAFVRDFAAVLPFRRDQVIGSDSDFFECGGHSLLVVELISRIAHRTGISLPLSTLIGAPTPQLVAAAVQTHSSYTYSPLVPLAPSPESREIPSAIRPVLYFVHGAGGHVLRFQKMAYALRDRVEVIGIQAIGVEGNDRLDPDLASMVARYVAAITSDIANRPNQTVHLGGYSSGGSIALHIAHQLAQHGHRVGSMSLVDCYVPIAFPNGLFKRLGNLGFNATHRDGLGLGKWLTGSVDGWRRRRNWDSEGAIALTKLGFNDVFDSIAAIVEAGPTPVPIATPALLIRSYSENPMRRRDYTYACKTPQSVRTHWIQVKHDELFTDERSSEVATQIGDFVSKHSS